MAKNEFSYFFRECPEVLKELKALGIEFQAVAAYEGNWPALRLPSGTMLAIAQDDEGNGPGAIHVFAAVEGK